MKRLSPEDINATIEAFVSALILGTDPVANEAHKVAPCPVVIWEDVANLDLESLEPFSQYKPKGKQ